MIIDKSLHVTGKHLAAKTRFEESLINARKKMWVGKDSERLHSKKALLTSKRMADLLDDQVKLWKRLKRKGHDGKGTRFSENLQEIEKRLVQIQHFLIGLAREIQQEFEADTELVAQSGAAAREEQQERKEARRQFIILHKTGRESSLHQAQTTKELEAIRTEIEEETGKFHKYNTLVQTGSRLMNINRVVYQKIQKIMREMIPSLREHIAAGKWKGFGDENAQQQAHNIVFYCKKIDDDILGKKIYFSTIGKLF